MFYALAVSGGGLELDSLPATDAAIGKGDFIARARRFRDAIAISTHKLNPSIEIKRLPSGAFTQTLFSSHIPSLILVFTASTV